MLINTKFKMLIRTRINNPHPIFLPLLPFKLAIPALPVEFIAAIDEAVVSWDGRVLSFGEPDFEDWGVIPILHHHGAKVDVPVCAAWAVDYYWADKPFAVLQGEVGVVPGCAVASCSEPVCE